MSAKQAEVSVDQSEIMNSLAAAGERIARLRTDALAQASAATTATDDYVQDNPWQAIGIAAAVAALAGLAAGLWIARR